VSSNVLMMDCRAPVRWEQEGAQSGPVLPVIHKTRCRHDLDREVISALDISSTALPTYRCTRMSRSETVSFDKSIGDIWGTYPWLCRVEINALYPLGAGKQLPLHWNILVSNLSDCICRREVLCHSILRGHVQSERRHFLFCLP
jgi:hypothetical protein